MPPTRHAQLSPSSAERWLHCTASVEATAGIREATSPYAAEGTLAHALAEHYASVELAAGDRDPRQGERYLAEARERGWDTDAMERAARGWAELVGELAAQPGGAMVFLERRVSPGIDGVWGTADATVVTADGTLHVLDLKYGQGVRVEADRNVQLMLYGLGAYEMVRPVAPGIERVRLAIYQPRAGGLREWTVPLAELVEWRETVRTVVEAIADGRTEYRPSEAACRWCPIRTTCRERIAWTTAADFSDGPCPTYDDADLPELIARAEEAERWARELLRHALSLAETGARIDGYKVVAGRTSRKIADPDRAVSILTDAGRTELVRTTPETITTLERGARGRDAGRPTR